MMPMAPASSKLSAFERALSKKAGPMKKSKSRPGLNKAGNPMAMKGGS